MTTEMGPRDVDLSIDERLAARVTRYTTAIVSGLSDDVSARFDPDRATLSLSGESEDSGDAFNRGLLVGLVYLLNLTCSMFAIGVASEAASAAADIGPVMGAVVLVPFLFVSAAAMVFALGSVRLMWKTDVVDHTVPPDPDGLDKLQQAYVDGDLDQAELDRRVEEVLDR